MLHVTFLTMLRALIDSRHVNHIRYYYYLDEMEIIKDVRKFVRGS